MGLAKTTHVVAVGRSTIGGYALEGCIGRGGMGVVYQATAPDGHPVALKLLPVEAGCDRNRVLVSRFLREARVLRRLNHRGIVTLYGAGIVDGYVYLAMERIRGVSLRAVHERSALNLSTVLWLGAEIASTLAHLHEVGIVHRDIKPSNIIIDQGGLPRLIDFGISTYSGATNITRKHDVLGTLGFIAPEVLEGEATAAADQYSLGRMLIALSSPASPVRFVPPESRYRRLLEGLNVDWARFPDGGRWPLLQVILQRMVSEHTSRRYEDMDTCARALGVLATEVGSEEQCRRILLGLAQQAGRGGEEGLHEVSLVTASPSWFTLEEVADQRRVATDIVRRRVSSIDAI